MSGGPLQTVSGGGQAGTSADGERGRSDRPGPLQTVSGETEDRPGPLQTVSGEDRPGPLLPPPPPGGCILSLSLCPPGLVNNSRLAAKFALW